MIGVMGMVGGMEIITSTFVTDTVQRRKNKKKRTNKKWFKNYGTKQAPSKNALVVKGVGILFHPKTWDVVKRKIDCFVPKES